MTISLSEVRPLLLQAFPRIGDELEESGSNYLDVATVARGAIAAAQEGQESELTALFACVERLFVEGDQDVQTLMGSGFIEDLQNYAVKHADPKFDPDVFLLWLGPVSLTCWREMLTTFRNNPESLGAVVKTLQTQRNAQFMTRLELQNQRRKARHSSRRKT